MHKTRFKPAAEIQHALSEVHRVAIIACGFCANWNGVGGLRGAHFLRRRLNAWGKEVLAVQAVSAACCETIMRECLHLALKPHRAQCEALIVLSCAAGLKTAFLCEPGLPIYGALDSLGSTTITRREDPVARSLCTFCGHCVLSFTGGICPLAHCKAQRAYGPCARAPLTGPCRICVLDPARECVWREIIARGVDLQALEHLQVLHQSDLPRPQPTGKDPTPGPIRRPLGRMVALCSNPMARLVQLLY